MEKICGFAVVKKAKSNLFEDWVPLRIKDIYYHGVNRYSWISVYDPPFSEPPYNGILPTHYRKLLDSLYCTSSLKITDDLGIAQEILQFITQHEEEPTCEIVVIYSKEIGKYCGSFYADMKIHWLGEDVDTMLIEGIYRHPSLFMGFVPYLNQYGLFDINTPVSDAYIEYYYQLLEATREEDILEPFPFCIDGVRAYVDKVWVGVPEL
ncbi:hypothetical protein [Beggiatoa leptomitoformis]|uniref:Uncharacterized protein n=1 Tax=Beggiatoa leptomitoformis TaxID=288004 RepID=A0A2N9YE00_9GAMM|nr:hypothetical protein [Beggiatoa leptomitoformis]ALG68939.1 hypothetical protein AL038_16105 [Beggiatoa leptomitoformis]AUI68676.1 hypothetical protein BLE401_08145 [Beggiatoa leptomitoformis]